MIYPVISVQNPLFIFAPSIIQKPSKTPNAFNFNPISCSNRQNPSTIDRFEKPHIQFRIPSPTKPPRQTETFSGESKKDYEERRGCDSPMNLCGFGYWVQGFRCFPWLALNFHMVHNLSLHPSTLQLVQNAGNLPMVAKPLYGVLSDAIYIGGAHRIPYILTGVLFQILSWGSLAWVPGARAFLPTMIACILLSNVGASITEVANDALVAEYGKKNKMVGLQSYAFMASAIGGISGNLLGGFFLMKTPPETMFFVFSAFLSIQLVISSITREDFLGLPRIEDYQLEKETISGRIKRQFHDLSLAIREESISRPLSWLVASIAMVPVLSGSIFCYQTQCLNLSSSVVGLARVVGQITLLAVTVVYDRFWKRISMRKLIGAVQCLYAFSLLLDLVLVEQINLKLGISNEVFALCFSGLAETIAQFKTLPFSVLFASACPSGCEGSLTSFLASAVCLSSIVSGFLGVGLSSLCGIRSGDYSGLPLGIFVQFVAALVPLGWVSCMPMSRTIAEKERRRGRSRRLRKYRRVGRVAAIDCSFAYRRERKSELQK